MTINLTDPQAPVTDEELDQMIWKLERDGGMTPKMLSLMRELREVRRAKMVVQPVMFIDGDISTSDADKLASIIREWDDAPVPAATDEREAFNAWNNDIDCPLAGLTTKQAAWLAWLKRSGTIKTFDAISPPFKVHDEFEVWAKAEGLIHDSYGLRTINSSTDVARKAWDACRAAMLNAEKLNQPVSETELLPPGYLLGHQEGLEWAAQMAEANHPQTGDWLYDDPTALAAAIRKGPDMPLASGNSPATPDGWVLVPEDPTHEMLEAGDAQFGTYDGIVG